MTTEIKDQSSTYGPHCLESLDDDWVNLRTFRPGHEITATMPTPDFLAAVEAECGVRCVPAEVAEALGSLARVTSGQDEVMERLEQALMIAQMGGVSNEVLGVLLHLAVTRMMTPTVAQRLRDVGIDPDRMDALVIERAELPPVTMGDGFLCAGQTSVVTGTLGGETALVRERRRVLEDLALAEYLDAHPPVPPVDEADVEALARDIFAARWPGISWEHRSDEQKGDYRAQARRLLATGRVSVTHE